MLKLIAIFHFALRSIVGVSSLVACPITDVLFQFYFNNSTKMAQGYPIKFSLKCFLIFNHSSLVMKPSMCYEITDR